MPPDAVREPPNEPSFSADERYLNRELSWLAFNDRVLALAQGRELPLLERVKFVAIVGSNLDEFFQVRVGALKAGGSKAVRSPDGRTAREQLLAIRAQVTRQIRNQQDLWEKELLPELAQEGVRIAHWGELTGSQRDCLAKVYDETIFPVLTPLTVDPSHPFPYISNLSLNLAVIVRDPATEVHRFARVKVPALLPRFQSPEDGVYVPIEEVIAAHLDSLFPGMEILSHHPFRLTLDAELAIEEREVEDLRAAIQSELHRRNRLNDAVRLETQADMSDQVRELLRREFELDPGDLYESNNMLDFAALWSLHGLDRPDLKDPGWAPVTQARLQGADTAPDIFRVIDEGDVFVHHPYDAFATSVEALLTQAADDPHVLAIKHTLYRTSGHDNPLTRALIRAAQAGKEVVALIELKARFDEESNLEWARTLKVAGAHVVYGLVGLKTHAKIALIVRRVGGEIRRYWHVGTGNYNPVTADFYEDVGLMSSDPEIGADLAELFNRLTGLSRPVSYRKTLVAPEGLRPALLEEIRREAAQPDGRIVIKVNNLSDPEVIDALYDASQAGCEIDLIVRGICCLRPGVPGLSENICVRSVVGRYLEHSRIFRFGSHERGPRYLIGSADLMTNKLDKRVEAVIPVEGASNQRRLEEIFALNLSENRLAWELGPDGAWIQRWPQSSDSSQIRFQELAQLRQRSREVAPLAPKRERRLV